LTIAVLRSSSVTIRGAACAIRGASAESIFTATFGLTWAGAGCPFLAALLVLFLAISKRLRRATKPVTMTIITTVPNTDPPTPICSSGGVSEFIFHITPTLNDRPTTAPASNFFTIPLSD
jgi:hypothetical protein